MPEEEVEKTTPPQNSETTVFDEVAARDGLNKDEARLTILQEEYSEVEDKLYDEFETILANNPQALFDEETLETLASDSNIASKNKILRDRYEKFRDERLSSKKSEISKFEEALNGKKKEFDVASQWTKFAKENPEVNMDEFGEFLEEDLTIRKRKELIETSKTKYDFLVAAYEIYKKEKGTKEHEDDLPPDLSQVNGATGNNSFENEAKEDAYLKQIGAIR